jgi:hypothetical protein
MTKTKKLFYMRPEKRLLIRATKTRPTYDVVVDIIIKHGVLYDGANPIAGYNGNAFVVYVSGYPPVLIPYIERPGYIELITIIPDRRLSKKYAEEMKNAKKKRKPT